MMQPKLQKGEMTTKAFHRYLDKVLLGDQDNEPIKTFKTPKKDTKESRDAKSPIKPYRQKSPPSKEKSKALKRSPPRGGKSLKEKQKSFNDDLNHVFLSPEAAPEKHTNKESLTTPPQSNQESLSTTTGSSSRRSRKERAEQRVHFRQEERHNMKDQLDRLEKNVQQIVSFVHADGSPKSRAQSAQGPAKSESLTRKSKEEQSSALRQTLNRVSAHCMQKFDEANAKLAEMEKEIAKRRRGLACEMRNEKEKPKQEKGRVLIRKSSGKSPKFTRKSASCTKKPQMEKEIPVQPEQTRMVSISIEQEWSTGSARGKSEHEKFEVPAKKKSVKRKKGNKLVPIAITGRITRSSASRPSLSQRVEDL